MGKNTGISWCDATWNPIRGCTVVSEGCANCYAATMAARFGGPGQAYEGLAKMSGGKGIWTGKVTIVEHMLDLPLRWKKPQRIFVNSMSDLFHDAISDDDIKYIWRVMKIAKQHTFLVLTKRPARMRAFVNRHSRLNGVVPNIWLGVSAENQQRAHERIWLLLDTPAAVRFASIEPQLGPVDLHDFLREDAGPAWAGENRAAPSLDWVIVGGESGRNHRPFDPQWARDLRDQCLAAGVPYFFKQHGGLTSRSGGDLLDGQQWHQFPA